jgi:hypothetical protein
MIAIIHLWVTQINLTGLPVDRQVFIGWPDLFFSLSLTVAIPIPTPIKSLCSELIRSFHRPTTGKPTAPGSASTTIP